ncbi:MAG: hypothetical protein JJE36_06855 [Coriobacteriia bacterium]|nr:hypothetical protein [Coriobacteriia bacterium]
MPSLSFQSCVPAIFSVFLSRPIADRTLFLGAPPISGAGCSGKQDYEGRFSFTRTAKPDKKIGKKHYSTGVVKFTAYHCFYTAPERRYFNTHQVIVKRRVTGASVALPAPDIR